MTKNKKRRALGVGLLSGAALVGAAAAIPFVVNAPDAQDYVQTQDGTIASSHLQFTATGVAVAKQAAASPVVVARADAQQAASAPTAGFVSVPTTDGTRHTLYVDPDTDASRPFMPILSNPDGANGTNQAYMRSAWQVDAGEYPGWTKGVGQNGLTVYAPTEYLKRAYPAAPEQITALRLYAPLSDASLRRISELRPQFVELWGLTQNDIGLLSDKLSEYSFIQKLTFQGSFTAFVGVSLPQSAKELEFVRAGDNKLERFDPLSIPAGAKIVSDAGSSSYADVIDLSVGHAKMTAEELQKAVTAVYSTYINTRLFQGYFAGGYVYKWDLRNTGITSFNGVSVPAINDGTGRFYVDSVDVYSDGSQATVSESVSPQGPSNDSRIGRIYDWNDLGWSAVKTVKVTSKDGSALPLQTAAREIEGFLRKYPNLETVDLSSLRLAGNKPLSDLVAEIKADLTDPMTGETTQVAFATQAPAA